MPAKPRIFGRFVGINYERSRNSLAGCINDAHDWKGVWDFASSNSALLLESNATKTGIIRFLRGALEQLGADDWLVATLSGHGTQVPDANGGDESDRFDEAFCPYDMDKGLLYDDEIAELLTQRHPQSKVLLITDCCHSGTMARGRNQIERLARFIPYDNLIQGMTPFSEQRLRERVVWPRKRGHDDGVFHLSGCTDKQVSWDATFGGRSNGALSYYAVRALTKLVTGTKLEDSRTFFEWYQAIRVNLPTSKFDQTPQLNGEENGAQDWWRVNLPGFETVAPPPPAVSPVVDVGPTSPQCAEIRIICGDWETEPIKWRKRAA